MARANAIETSDLVRKSAYSFEIHNNNLRIFPEPLDGDAGEKIWFEYYVKDDIRNTNNPNADLQGGVSDPSNVPYKFITYSSINQLVVNGLESILMLLLKSYWVLSEVSIVLCLIPDGEVTLDGEALKTEGREENTIT